LYDADMHLLMNHRLPSVNADYITRSKLMVDQLRPKQEKRSGLIVEALEEERSPQRRDPDGIADPVRAPRLPDPRTRLPLRASRWSRPRRRWG
jgi:hypothetical protein